MAIREPMTIKAWPDLRIGTGEVAENLKIFWGKVGEFIWGPRFWFSFFVTHVTQQVTKRKYNSSWCLSECHRCLFWCLHCLLQRWKTYVPSTLLKNCLTFYLAKYTVNISALQHYCFLKLQLICLYMKYQMFSRWALVFRSLLLPPLVARAVVAVVIPARNALEEQRWREERGILVAHVL